MTLDEAADHCEQAWSSYAKRHGIRRDFNAFYLLKMQEELGELTRRYLEMTGGEYATKDGDALRKKFEGDCASVIGNALILARHFGVDITSKILEKFPAE
ncbi:hypothetical protein EO087_08530 [Dyella sp. M7H15-1]|uniref:hypothetical protein n=1 Tax=Dyella sp. M7H15-1 TaxID=2501295 RepID=UPI001004F8D4|nr:hypothetical protein [Dyella sp. M7H15-1]QAU24031.1 hypothetical protein EO087_08530 [Dyella sp. M7H15-1]